MVLAVGLATDDGGSLGERHAFDRNVNIRGGMVSERRAAEEKIDGSFKGGPGLPPLTLLDIEL